LPAAAVAAAAAAAGVLAMLLALTVRAGCMLFGYSSVMAVTGDLEAHYRQQDRQQDSKAVSTTSQVSWLIAVGLQQCHGGHWRPESMIQTARQQSSVAVGV
jgi:hypothetical protein